MSDPIADALRWRALQAHYDRLADAMPHPVALRVGYAKVRWVLPFEYKQLRRRAGGYAAAAARAEKLAAAEMGAD